MVWVEVVVVWVAWLRVLRILSGWRGHAASRTLHVESVLHECYAQAGSGAVFGGVGGVEEVREEETDELEGHGDHAVPDEGEDGADRKPFIEDLVWPAEPRCENGGFPIRWCGVCSGLFVCLGNVSVQSSRSRLDSTYRWVLLCLLTGLRLCTEVRKHAV